MTRTILGVFFVAIAGAILYNSPFEKAVFDTVRIVDVSVVEAPASCKNISKRTFCKLRYNGTIHSIRITRKYCKHVVDKKHLKMHPNSSLWIRIPLFLITVLELGLYS